MHLSQQQYKQSLTYYDAVNKFGTLDEQYFYVFPFFVCRLTRSFFVNYNLSDFALYSIINMY